MSLKHLKHAGRTSRELLQARMLIQPLKVCSNNPFYESFDHDVHLCLGKVKKNSDANICSGDSGGPLMCTMDRVTWYLTGISSFVIGLPVEPKLDVREVVKKQCVIGVAAKVRSYLEFLQNLIKS
ncbi:hypothetical protein HELRODRAFT_167337 [Helobdella robusta]|uniref:Peptidase S1 domain-containing protein n=1 Tax=Helobdella robusta TaxID=6412 RepID=T1EZ99_HELRO|nr:hypothetical protein HELRODRAFT_167337 [Helobdella robusta]ESO10835.1 hypothetical protein HELRODRAFT_167337 [Helobdella robusta]